MENRSVIVDSLHVLNYQKYESKESICQYKIYIVQDRGDSNQYFFLVKKGEAYNDFTKYSFIEKCEKSIELTHPTIIGLEGFSIEKPYLYYQYLKNSHNIDDIELTHVNIQKMFLGIASGLSFLLSRGYYFNNFSTQSIIFDEKSNPKFYDYINFEDSNKNFEKDLIVRYCVILNTILNKKRDQDKKLAVDDELENLIMRSQQKSDLPKLEDFVTFFKTKSYCANKNVIKDVLFQEYKKNFEIAEEYLINGKFNYTNNYETLEQTCTYFYKNTHKADNQKNERCFALNSLPEYYIKLISKFFSPMKAIFNNFIYYDDLSLIIGEWNELVKVNHEIHPFKIYQVLKNKIHNFEEKKSKTGFFSLERKSYDQKIDAMRIQSIYYLKKAYERSHDTKVMIELAVQYINGDILPYNLQESLSILEKINDRDKETQAFVNQMKNKITLALSKLSIKKILQRLSPKQQQILQKAEEGSILAMLYVGFAFYTGFNGFPIIRSLSIEYYLKASTQSPHAMLLLGYLYLKGVIFPQNFEEAKNCFQKAASSGYIKAEIIDAYFRRHLWRKYLIECDINDVFQKYLPSFSSILNDGYVIPQINYLLDTNVKNDFVCKAKLESTNEKRLLSEKVNENYSMFFKLEKDDKCIQKFKYYHSSKIILQPPEISEKKKNADNLLLIAKSYFYGINNYPVNYSIASKYFKKAADKNNSEAQWRYALMCDNGIGEGSYDDTEKYLRKSSDSGDITGKLYLALFLRNSKYSEFEELIEECKNSDNLDAQYFYGMYLEKVDETLDGSIQCYKEAADNGHFESLIRLIYLLRIKMNLPDSEKDIKDEFEYYLDLSVAILNESLLVHLINFLDGKENNYKVSNILINFGMKMNHQLFNSLYADHLLYGKGIPQNEERAEKLVYLAYNSKYPEIYWERYIYILLEIKIKKFQHTEAAEFLIKNKKYLTEKHRKKYLKFFRKINKTVAQDYFITANFCNKQYLVCHDQLILLRKKANVNFIKVFSKIRNEVMKNNNAYAMAIMGKLFKQGKYIMRDLKAAVQYFQLSAENHCPDGYYYLGKEYYYGRILKRNYDKAKENFLAAIQNYGEPRAGYYLYKISKMVEVDNDIEYLKQAATFGYKKALYKYGHLIVTGKDKRIEENIEEGKNYILLSASQDYKKAVKYCKDHGIVCTDTDKTKDLYARFGSLKLDIEFSDEDSDIDNEKINNLVDKIKLNKTVANFDAHNAVYDRNVNDFHDDDNDDDDTKAKLFDLINSLQAKKTVNTINLIDDEKESDSNLNQPKNNKKKTSKATIEDGEKSPFKFKFNLDDDLKNSVKISADDITNKSQKVNAKDTKKSSIKFKFDDDKNNSDLDNPKKDKKSTSKINVVNDDKNDSDFDNPKKDKKSTSKINAVKDDRKNSPKIKIFDDEENSSDFYSPKKDKKNTSKPNAFKFEETSSEFDSPEKAKKKSPKTNAFNDDKNSSDFYNPKKVKNSSPKPNVFNDEETSSEFYSPKKAKKSTPKPNAFNDDKNSSDFYSPKKDKKKSQKINTFNDEDNSSEFYSPKKTKKSTPKSNVFNDEDNSSEFNSPKKTKKNTTKSNVFNDEDNSSDFDSHKKTKKSTPKSNVFNDEDNSSDFDSPKKKKSSDLPASKKDNKHAKNKDSDLSINEDSDNINDLINFWY